MAYSALTQPHTFMAGYSAIPLRLNSTSVETSDKFKYLTSIAYSGVTVSAATSVGIGAYTYAKLFTTTAHGYSQGDKILFADEVYGGYYNIVSITSPTSFAINLVLGSPFTGTSKTYLGIPYTMPPDYPDGEAKLDLSNTLKDFVTENLQDVNEIYSGHNTKFNFDIFCGEEKSYVFEFEDNAPSGFGGYVGFYNTTLVEADIENIPFEIGDTIIIEQDVVSWNYNTTYGNGVGSTSGYLVLSSTTLHHNFSVGQPITITGQITNPNWNGTAVVLSVPSDPKYWMTTSVPLVPTGATTNDAGVVMGVPKPTYNTTATITDILYNISLGVVIVTNVQNAGASLPISGTIKLADDTQFKTYDDLVLSGFSIYNAKIEKKDFGFVTTQFDKYIIKNRAASLNNISTILSGSTKYRIETSTKSWLLNHCENSGFGSDVKFTWYNGNTVLGNTVLHNVSSNQQDYYFPVGIDQVLASANKIETGATLSSIYNTIDNYSVVAIETSGKTSALTNAIWFELNEDCSRFELFHLMWKDSKGSWISYPFKYVSENKMEVERKDYYKQEGTWNTTNNTFGYDSFDRGQKSFFVRSREKYTINSGWVEPFENNLMKDLMSSPSVYVQLPDNTLVGCVIENKDIKFGKLHQDYIWNYTFNISVSHNENRF